MFGCRKNKHAEKLYFCVWFLKYEKLNIIKISKEIYIF